MLITVQSIDDFIISLKDKDSIFEDTIRVDISRGNPNDTVREVVLHATAVVPAGEGEYLLQLGMDCGKDYHDSSQEFKGWECATAARGHLTEFAQGKGWKVLPGVIGA